VKIKSGSVGDGDAGGWRPARGHLPAERRERRRAKVGELMLHIAHTCNYVSLRNNNILRSDGTCMMLKII
jgi:hypothetical protein